MPRASQRATVRSLRQNVGPNSPQASETLTPRRSIAIWRAVLGAVNLVKRLTCDVYHNLRSVSRLDFADESWSWATTRTRRLDPRPNLSGLLKASGPV